MLYANQFNTAVWGSSMAPPGRCGLIDCRACSVLALVILVRESVRLIQVGLTLQLTPMASAPSAGASKSIDTEHRAAAAAHTVPTAGPEQIATAALTVDEAFEAVVKQRAEMAGLASRIACIAGEKGHSRFTALLERAEEVVRAVARCHVCYRAACQRGTSSSGLLDETGPGREAVVYRAKNGELIASSESELQAVYAEEAAMAPASAPEEKMLEEEVVASKSTQERLEALARKEDIDFH